MSATQVKFVPDLLKFAQILNTLKASLRYGAFDDYISMIIGSAGPAGQHPLDFFRDMGQLSAQGINPNLQRYLSERYGGNEAVKALFAYYTPLAQPSSSSTGFSVSNDFIFIEYVGDFMWNSSYREGWGQFFDPEMLMSLSHSQFIMKRFDMPRSKPPKDLSDVMNFVKMTCPKEVKLADFIAALEILKFNSIAERVKKDITYRPADVFVRGVSFEQPPVTMSISGVSAEKGWIGEVSTSSSPASRPTSFKTGKKIEGDLKMKDVPSRLFIEVWNDRFTRDQIHLMKKHIPSDEIELAVEPVNFLEIWRGMKAKEQTGGPETSERTVSEWLHFLEELRIPSVSFAPLWQNINNPQASAATRGFLIKNLTEDHISFIIGRADGFVIEDWENLFRLYELRYPKDSIADPYDLFDLLLAQKPELSLELMKKRAAIGSSLHQLLEMICDCPIF